MWHNYATYGFPVISCAGAMPQVPAWYQRIPGILARLRLPNAPPVLDRTAVEELFGLQRRQAIRVLNSAGGYQVGKTFIVGRDILIQFLEGIAGSPPVRQSRARQLRVAAVLKEAADLAEASRVEIRPVPAPASGAEAGLPRAVELLGPGKLQISYEDAEDLLGRIVELASAAADNFPAFRKLYGGGK